MELTTQESSNRPLRLLSLDGGGIRGISELVILEEIMHRVGRALKVPKPLPADYFDMICGTSTGGLIALLLGRLRLSVPEAIDKYRVLAEQVFSQKKPRGKDGTFKASKLEKAIKETIEWKLGKDHAGDRMFMTDTLLCKTFVCAVPAKHINRQPRLFRTWLADKSPGYNCTIWEAARATSAAPTFFKRIYIGDAGLREEFIDAGIGCNNPVRYLVEEAGKEFGPERTVSCIVSIGAGKPKVAGFKVPGVFQRVLPLELINVLASMATDSETEASVMKARFQNCSGLYHRLDVERGLEEVSLEEWEKLGEVKSHTMAYLSDGTVSRGIDVIVDALVGKSSKTFPLGQLDGAVAATIHTYQREEKAVEAADLAKCLHLLSVLDFEERQYELYHGKRQDGTSTWILQTDEFRRWIGSSNSDEFNSFLLISGGPGSGKSIACAVIIDHLLGHCANIHGRATVYFYCQYQERGIQTAEALLGSFIKQLVLQNPKSECIVRSFLHSNRKKRILSVPVLMQLAERVAEDIKTLYFVADGLDELSSDVATTVKTLIDTFAQAEIRKKHNFHVIVSGRPYVYQTTQWGMHNKIEMVPNEADLRKMVKMRLIANSDFQAVVDGDLSWQGRIVAGIVKRTLGQIAPFALAITYIQRICEETSRADAVAAFRDLKSTLPEQYDQTLQRIEQSERRATLAYRTFAWLLQVKTLLSPDELCEALAIDSRDTNLSKARKRSIQVVLDACKGFVIIGNSSKRVELFHHTLVEHLSSKAQLVDLMPQIPGKCLSYLLYEDFKHPCTDTQAIAVRQFKYPFAAYASVFWSVHVGGQVEAELQDEICRLLSGPAMYSSLQLVPSTWVVDYRFLGDLRMPVTGSPWDEGRNAVFFASYFGLQTTVTKLINSGCDPNIQSSEGEHYAPLHVAVWRSYLQMVDELVKAGAKVDVQDKWGLTPLHVAMRVENTTTSRAIIERLLTAKASTTIRDQDGDTVLHAAASRADAETMRCLLGVLDDIDVTNDRKQTALHYAIRRGEIAIIETILLAGADPSLLNDSGVTALKASVDSDDLNAVKLILQNDESKSSPRLSRQDREMGANYVRYRNHEAALAALAAREEEIDSYLEGHDRARAQLSSSRSFGFPRSVAADRQEEMWWAALKRDLERLETLVSTNVSLDSTDWRSGNTALHEAIFLDRPEAVILLLAAGANRNIKTRRGRTAGELAVVMSRPRILQLLEEEQWKTETCRGKTGLELQTHFRSLRRGPEPGER